MNVKHFSKRVAGAYGQLLVLQLQRILPISFPSRELEHVVVLSFIKQMHFLTAGAEKAP